MIAEFDQAILTTDIPESQLRAGDVGTVVDVLADGKGYIVEFMTMEGETIDVVVLHAQQMRPVGDADIPHVRTLTVPHAGDG